MVVLVSFSPPTEGIIDEQKSIKVLKNNVDIGTGTLYIAESALAWRNYDTGEGFSLRWPQIGLHGVTKDVEQFGYECLYILVTQSDEIEEFDSEPEPEDEEFGGNMEMKFIPEDKTQLDQMYQAMNYCQSLHPDPKDEISDEEFVDADEEGEYYLGGGDSGFVEGLNDMRISNGHANGDNMEAEGQFEDAEEDEDY